MSTISINRTLNKIYSEKNLLNKSSNLKELFKPYDLEIEKQIRQIELLNDNFNFCYSEEEFVSFTKHSYEIEDLLESLNYLPTTQEKYINEEYNVVYKINNLKNKKYNLKNENIKYFDGAKDLELKIIYEDNLLIFYNENQVYFEYEFIKDIVLKKVLHFQNKLFFHLNYKNNDWIILTSISHDFAKENKINSIEDISCFYKIKLGYEFDQLINIERNKITFFNKFNKDYFEIILGKRYYFDYQQNIYFTDLDNFQLNSIKEKTLHLEFLYLYDYIHLLGLSDLVNEDNEKIINSKIIKNKEDLFKLKIDNTKNGLINYQKIKNNIISFYKNDNVNITGNFYINNLSENSNYKILTKIKILNNKYNFIFELFIDNKFFKKINIITYSNYAYFCNLKFELINFIDNEFEINIKEKDLLNLKNITFKFNDEFYNNKNSYEFNMYNNRIINKNFKLLNDVKINNDIIENLNLLINNNIISFKELKLNLNNENNINLLKDKDDTNNYLNFNIKEKNLKLNKITKEKEIIKIIKHEFNLNIKGV